MLCMDRSLQKCCPLCFRNLRSSSELNYGLSRKMMVKIWTLSLEEVKISGKSNREIVWDIICLRCREVANASWRDEKSHYILFHHFDIGLREGVVISRNMFHWPRLAKPKQAFCKKIWLNNGWREIIISLWLLGTKVVNLTHLTYYIWLCLF